ncbi:M20 metallopeptidase family protein [Rhodococcoides fascians]|uniref:M20 metallopeptidase family protein n=1 Tax=Rhodococcoides fascians TaxID=1828 RepID=UPI00050D06F5|nr:M20 family metallopeptidase [Rhodococcus fascians]
MNLPDDADAMAGDLVQLRRSLHRTPEVGLDLPRTQEMVLDGLAGLPLEIHMGTATTSVTAVLRGTARTGTAVPTVLLRADMDALPVVEQTGLDFAAQNGAMHGCGHDLHTAALVGAAQLLSRHRDRVAGDVVLMFQPGEEGWDGAAAMIDEGVLDASGRRADAAYGLHVFSSQQRNGTFFSRPGTLLAASYRLSVTVRGEGGHGSSPSTARDPVTAMAEMITSMQTMVTRTFDVFDPVVVTVAHVRAGVRHNIIPDDATFEATVRCYSARTYDAVPTALRRVLEGVATAHRVDVDVSVTAEFPMTVNDIDETGFGAATIAELLGEERYETAAHPLSGSEDFSYVLQEVPGAFIGLGACMPDNDPADAPMNHSPRAEFDDSVLVDAATVYAGLAIARLDHAPSPESDAR